MKKTKSPLSKQPPQAPTTPVVETRSFGRTFLIKKGNSLVPEPEITEGNEPEKKELQTDEFPKLIKANRAIIFGEKTLGIHAVIGDSLFDAFTFLFDFASEKPRCFILSMITSGLPFDFFFMELTRIFRFLRNTENRMKIVDVLKADIESDKVLTKAFRELIGKETSIDIFLTETIITRCRVLWLTDGRRPQLPELVEAYTETWRTMLSVMYFEKYQVGKLSILSVYPELAELTDKPKEKEKKPREPKVEHTEDHHFSKTAPVVRSIFEKLKTEAMKLDKTLVFNPSGKHYIAMKKQGAKNACFFHFRKHGLYIVVKLDEKVVRRIVKKSTIHSLPLSVQRFWNGSSTGITITSLDHLKEIVEVLKKLIKG